jgi:hypothetical protein
MMTLIATTESYAKKPNIGKAFKSAGKGIEKVGKDIGKDITKLAGKKNPLTEIIKIVEKLPAEIKHLIKTMDDSYKEVKELHGKTSGAVGLNQLKDFEKEVDDIIEKLESMEEKFIGNPIAKDLEKASDICDLPPIMAFAALPTGGGAAGVVCGKAKSGHSMFVGIGAKMTAIINRAMQVKADLSRKLDALEAKAGGNIEETVENIEKMAGSAKGTVPKASAATKK